MRLAIGVLARAPVAGRCKRRLLAAHEGAWAAGLCAAMLRDTLDGLLSVEAAEYVVVASPLPRDEGDAIDAGTRAQGAADVLARHVPAPWRIVVCEEDDVAARLAWTARELLARADVALLASADAPSAPLEPLATALASLRGDALLGPTDQGGAFLFGLRKALPASTFAELPWATPALAETIRVRCKESGLALAELPPWYTVDEPSDVLRLLDELRKHPERAPRTAQFLVTNA